MSTYHSPVLLREAVEALCVKADGVYLDGTLGGGGHFQAVVDLLGEGGTAIGVDRDGQALAWADTHLNRGRGRVILEHGCYSEAASLLAKNGVPKANGILLDLGVSSRQIDDASRGFMYREDAVLDMRMDGTTGPTAREILADADADALAALLAGFGEVRNSGRMAHAIVAWRQRNPLHTSADLRACLAGEYGGELSPKVLSKVFQALRIAVNHELIELTALLSSAADCLATGGRLVIISYHSLEDREVKTFLKTQENPCTCPTAQSYCTCATRPVFKRITRKAVRASEEEVSRNPRARSARLRVGERI